MAERGEQVCGISVDWTDSAGAEELREDALHRVAVLEHVGDPGRATTVVFKDEVAAVLIADQVGATDVDVGVLRDGDADEFRPVMCGAEHDLGRDHAFLDDTLLMVDIVEEEIQGRDPLDQSGFDMLPFAGRDHTREGVEREDAFRAFLVSVDRERDALFEEEQFEAAELLAEFFVA